MMSATPVDVLLITSDERLLAAVRRRTPEGIRLHCCAPEAITASLPVQTRELWLDLDTACPVAGAGCERRVYFHTGVRPALKDLPPGLHIRKPVSRAVLDVLWAGVRPAGPVTGVATDFSESIPGWLLSFHDLRLSFLCDKLVVGLARRFGYRTASLYLYDAGRRLLTLSQTTRANAVDLAVPIADPPTSLMTYVALRRERILTADIAETARQLQLNRDGTRVYADGTALIVPLVCDDVLAGVLSFAERQPDAPDLTVWPLDAVFAFLGRALYHARLHSDALAEARVDPLTSLYNKRWLDEALAREVGRAARYATPLSILMIDLDGLKTVNDQHGHVAGDAMLQHFARRLTGVLRQMDGAARVGGDEFVIILPDTNAHGARRVAGRLLRLIRAAPALVDGRPIPLSASIGAVQWTPGTKVAILLTAADQAMYRAKQRGGDTVSGQVDAATDDDAASAAPPARFVATTDDES